MASAEQPQHSDLPFIDIWHGTLSDHVIRQADYLSTLSDDEVVRAQALLSEAARCRFIIVRGLLRQVLSGYLACRPAAIAFRLGEYGKPELCGHPLAFNLSHSQDKLLIAVSDLPMVGVDVETIKPRKGMTEIARRCFSAREFDYWQTLSPSQQSRMFFRLWTIKEAFVKAVGRGIALGLERCEVDVENFARFASLPPPYQALADWRSRRLLLEEHWCAAAVVCNADHQLRYFKL